MIPKTIHQIWLGPAEIDSRFVRWARGWRDLHPDWDVVLWTDQPEDHSGPWTDIAEVPPLINADLLTRVFNLTRGGCKQKEFSRRMAVLSDMVRMEVIARFGGIYVDLDVECFQPIDDLLEGVRLCCADEQRAGGNYLFGAVPNHPAMWTCVRELRTWLDTCEQGSNPVVVTGPYYLNRQLRKHADFVIFPWQLFQPLPAHTNEEDVKHYPRVSYGNHHFAGTWYRRERRRPKGPFVGGSQ